MTKITYLCRKLASLCNKQSKMIVKPELGKSGWSLADKKHVCVELTNLKYLQCISFSSKQALAQLSSV